MSICLHFPILGPAGAENMSPARLPTDYGVNMRVLLMSILMSFVRTTAFLLNWFGNKDQIFLQKDACPVCTGLTHTGN